MNIVYYNSNNLGDLTNIYIGLMYNYNHFIPIIGNKKYNNSIFMIGSILRYCDDNNIIFGSGLKESTQTIELKKNKVYCIRGKLTKKVLSDKDNILMMDPGLLIRKLYIPKTIETTKKMLIIPHYNHKAFFVNDTDEYNVMDIKFTNSDYNFITNYKELSEDNKEKILNLFNDKFNIINSYDLILSSSLHGLVFAHAFGKKTIYFKINEEKNEPNHKYNDYYSIYNMNVNPVTIKKTDIPNLKYNTYINNKSHNVDIVKYEKIINDADIMLKKILI